MNERPKFKTVDEFKTVPGSDIGYGPRLERVHDTESVYSQEDSITEQKPANDPENIPTEGWLNKAQRRSLRATLFALGMAVMSPMKDSTQPSSSEELAEKIDAFSLEVEKMKKQITEVDIAKTIKIASEPVPGYSGYTRMDYPPAKIKFRSEYNEKRKRPSLPLVLQEGLREVVPGWIAQESRYKIDAVSGSNATGLWQIKPSVYKEYRGTEKVSSQIDDQTEVAGELISDNYHYILHYAGEEAMAILRSKFYSDESFFADLMSPLLINAYNAGGPAIGKMLKKFVDRFPQEEMATGRDLFLQFADFAEVDGTNYSKEARDYVSKVYAFDLALKENSG